MMHTEISQEKITYSKLAMKNISAIAMAETTCDLSNIVTWTVYCTAWAEHVEIETESIDDKKFCYNIVYRSTCSCLFLRNLRECKSVLQYHSIRLKTSNLVL